MHSSLRVLAVAGSLAMAVNALAATVSTDVIYGTLNGTFEISNAYFVAVQTGTFAGDEAYGVQPGSWVEVAGDYTMTQTVFDPNTYCPGCLVQDYVGFNQPDAYGSAGIAFHLGDYFSQGSTPFDVFLTFNEVNSVGQYFIGKGGTLDFQYDPNIDGGIGTDAISGGPAFSYEIINTPEPASLMLLGSGVLVLLAGIARRKARR